MSQPTQSPAGPLCFRWGTAWPHTVPDDLDERSTPDRERVTCERCLHALGHQKYEPPRTPSPVVVSQAEPEVGGPERWLMAEAWERCAREAHDLGWLHDWALSDLLARNPYRDCLAVATSPVAPHKFRPDFQAGGDCAECGNIGDASVHLRDAAVGERATDEEPSPGASSDPIANGHRWPCPGYYTLNHEPVRIRSWTCTCSPDGAVDDAEGTP